MLSRRTTVIGLRIVAVFVLGVAVVSAQGYGNGNGNNGRGRDNGWNGIATQDFTDNQANQSSNQHMGQLDLDLQFGEVVDADLSDEIIEGLTITLLDEYAAYDVYDDIMEQLGEVRPFINLREAEANHALALESLFTRYGLELPEAIDVDVPEFATVTEACTWAYDIEVANVGLYDVYLPFMSDYPDITLVMTTLRDASLEKHMPALAGCSG